MSGPPQDQELPRDLVWRCRRGMRELDVLLLRWLHRRWSVSTPAEQQAFRDLLGAEDDQLWDWLLGRTRPDADEMRHIVDAIRNLSLTG
jgi:antitoxin CptB